jgi:diacylglycerol kinase (ATP)
MLAEVVPARRFAVIVNRGARAAAAVSWPRIVDVLRAQGAATELHVPRRASETARVARRLAARGDTILVAAGGDGTVHAIVNAVAHYDAAIAVLPLGTANDLARELGVPLDPTAAAHRLATARERAIDLIEVNGRRLCTVGGLGIPAACALAVDHARRAATRSRPLLRALGTRIYPLLAATTILRGRTRPTQLRLAWRDPAGLDHARVIVAAGVFIANQHALGAGLALPTASDHADGLFELCLVHAVSRVRLLAALVALELGGPLPRGVFEVLPATRARITSDEAQPIFADGESLPWSRHVDLRMRSRALRVLA